MLLCLPLHGLDVVGIPFELLEAEGGVVVKALVDGLVQPLG